MGFESSSYKNPWHKPTDKHSGPEFYVTSVRPNSYRGYLIYHRLSEVWDVVKDDVCITQMAGFTGARRAIDALIANQKKAEAPNV